MFLSVNVLIVVWRVSYVFIIIVVGTYIQITSYMCKLKFAFYIHYCLCSHDIRLLGGPGVAIITYMLHAMVS